MPCKPAERTGACPIWPDGSPKNFTRKPPLPKKIFRPIMALSPDLKEKLHRARLYLVSDQELSSGRTTTSVVEAALKSGVDIVQLREYSMTDGELLRVARELRQ